MTMPAWPAGRRPPRISRTRYRSTADPAGANVAVVVLGLGAALAFGVGDFGGGWASKRAAVFGVSLVVQVVGLVVVALAAILGREPIPVPEAFVLAALAGAVGVFGIIALYHGLAVGRMGVVAPVSGVLGALVPVGVGFVLEGLPPAIVWAGIALAILAVVLVTRAAQAEGGRSGLEFGLIAGAGIGLMGVFLGLQPAGAVFWPLVAMKLAAGVLLTAVIVIGRQAWAVPRAVLPVVLGVAFFDMAGNALYLLAAQVGDIAIASILSSLYPVATVVLAATLLREQITRSHIVGIAAAAAAIVLIGLGTT
jgi:drug/metabolite transporter (DMT)-like permease